MKLSLIALAAAITTSLVGFSASATSVGEIAGGMGYSASPGVPYYSNPQEQYYNEVNPHYAPPKKRVPAKHGRKPVRR